MIYLMAGHLFNTKNPENTFARILTQRFIFSLYVFMGRRINHFKLPENYPASENKTFKDGDSTKSSNFSIAVKYKKYDLMFSGDLIPQTMPLFFLAVAQKVKEIVGNCSVLIVGKGPLRNTILIALLKSGISFEYFEFLPPKHLNTFYRQSKILLFPAIHDRFGIFVNEVCNLGSTVIICENTGIINDQIIYEHHGLVLPLDENVWARHICSLLKSH
jgi:glycosyltransferase involved in cell wall biosynthesis